MPAQIPLAVPPSAKSPGFGIVIDLKAGNSAPGSGRLRALLLAPKGTGVGSITPDTQLVEAVAGEKAVADLLGIGTPGHLAAKRFFEEWGLATLDVAAPVESSGTAATGKFTFASGPPTADRTVRAYVAGRKAEVIWKAGESNQLGSEKLRDRIGALTQEMPVTAASAINGAGPSYDTNLTFKNKGVSGNDCKIRVEVVDGAGGTVTASGVALTTGSGEPDFTNVVTLIVGKEYDYIGLVTSNADVQSSAGSTAPGKLKTDISARNNGFEAKVQQLVLGATGALATLKTGIATLNFDWAEVVFCLNGESLPCEWMGAEMGARIKAETTRANVNRIEVPYKAVLFGAANLSDDRATPPEVEDALNSGITIVTYDSTNAPRPSRPITTYFKDGGGNADDRCLDVAIPTTAALIAKDLRVDLPREFPNAILSEDLSGEDEAPEGVVEVKSIKARVLQRLAFLGKRGIVQYAKVLDASANGTLIVRVNPSDPRQCDIVLPFTIFFPLAKYSLAIQHRMTG